VRVYDDYAVTMPIQKRERVVPDWPLRSFSYDRLTLAPTFRIISISKDSPNFDQQRFATLEVNWTDAPEFHDTWPMKILRFFIYG
jgi:hypothetical protein